MWTSANSNKLYNIRKVLMRAIKNVLFIELERLCQNFFGHFCKNFLAFFSNTHSLIWSCHVTQEANFEKFLFFPLSAFNIRKRYKISSTDAGKQLLPGVNVKYSALAKICVRIFQINLQGSKQRDSKLVLFQHYP